MTRPNSFLVLVTLLASVCALTLYAQAPAASTTPPEPSIPPVLIEIDSTWQPITDSFGFVAQRIKPPPHSRISPGPKRQPNYLLAGEVEGYFLIRTAAGWCRVEENTMPGVRRLGQ